MRIMLATNNPSKVARVKKQLAGKPVEVLTPKDIGIVGLMDIFQLVFDPLRKRFL